jgi:hypothetical protein
MRGLKRDQLVMRADEELSGLRWLPDNFKALVPTGKAVVLIVAAPLKGGSDDRFFVSAKMKFYAA